MILVDNLSLLLVRPKIFINITSDVFHCHARGKISWTPHHSLPWSAVMSSHAVFMLSNRDIWSCALWSYTSTSILKKMVVIVLRYLLYMLPNLIGYSKWLIRIVLQLEVICQFSRHYNVNVRYLWNIHACIHIFDNWMDHLNVMHTRWKMIEKLWRVWLISFDHMKLVVVQTADNCTYCLHTCQSICNLLKSITYSNLMWTRS